MRRAALLVLALAAASSAHAELTRAEVDRVAVRPPAGAAAPLDVGLLDADTGRPTNLRAAAEGHPLVLVFADYACTTLCGPALAIVGQRVGEAGSPAADARLAVIGLAPDSEPAPARAFADARLPPPVRRRTAVLTGDAAAIRRLTRALGYGYRWDAQARLFAHPVAAFVLAPGGRLVRTLSEVALTGPSLAAALADARAGRAAPSLLQEVALVCHGALQAVGRFDAGALGALRVGGVATVLALAGGLAWLGRRRGGRAA